MGNNQKSTWWTWLGSHLKVTWLQSKINWPNLREVHPGFIHDLQNFVGVIGILFSLIPVNLNHLCVTVNYLQFLDGLQAISAANSQSTNMHHVTSGIPPAPGISHAMHHITQHLVDASTLTTIRCPFLARYTIDSGPLLKSTNPSRPGGKSNLTLQVFEEIYSI